MVIEEKYGLRTGEYSCFIEVSMFKYLFYLVYYLFENLICKIYEM